LTGNGPSLLPMIGKDALIPAIAVRNHDFPESTKEGDSHCRPECLRMSAKRVLQRSVAADTFPQFVGGAIAAFERPKQLDFNGNFELRRTGANETSAR
jgi:hypothetical protein